MRKLDRHSIAIPPSLGGPSIAVAREKDAAEVHYVARDPWLPHHTAYPFKNYKAPDVKLALRRLAHGNCAYCESKIGAVGAREVEHYRPKGGIEGLADHPGYWWLTHSWDNLLPTCRDCNKSLRQFIITADMTKAEVEALVGRRAAVSYGKTNQFEVRGPRAVNSGCNIQIEDPLLIDPSRQDPVDELTWNFSSELPLLEAKQTGCAASPYGNYTIRACALNRAELVLDRVTPLLIMKALRTKILMKLENWAGNAEDLRSTLNDVEILLMFAEPGQTYTGMAAAFINDFLDELDRWRMAKNLAPF
jgi:hypothetical protein